MQCQCKCDWITLSHLLLVRLREVSADQWQTILFSATERCLADARELVASNSTEVKRLLQCMIEPRGSNGSGVANKGCPPARV